MSLSSLKTAMKSVSQPVQPILQLSDNYETCLQDLNPLTEKMGGLFYQFSTDGDAKKCRKRVLPDGCVDILFKCDPESPSGVISGIHDEMYMLSLEPNTTYFGVKPYSALLGLKDIKGTPDELANHCFELKYFLALDSLEERIAQADTFNERISLFTDHYLKNWLDTEYSGTLAGFLSISVCTSGGKLSMDELEDLTGYSNRYCRKVFMSHYGVSIKKYSQFARFQKALNLLVAIKPDWPMNITDIAYETGYADAAHFINSFKELTNLSPKQFVRCIKSHAAATKKSEEYFLRTGAPAQSAQAVQGSR